MSPGTPASQRRRLPQGEVPRKLVHIGAGGFALLLPWLSWWLAALLAFVGFLFAWAVLPVLLGHRLRSEREATGDVGVLVYPVVVVALILFFSSHQPGRGAHVWTAFGWGLLAFGDGAAGLAGMLWGRHPLPWNRAKSWQGLVAFVVAGGGGGAALALWQLGPEWNRHVPGPAAFGAMVLAAAVLAALVESVPHGLDDNVLPALAGALVLFQLATAASWPRWTADETRVLLVAAAVNLVVALAVRRTGLLSTGGIASAAAIGTLTWVFGGWRAYLLLWVFLVLAMGATLLGRTGKRARGLEDEARRGAANVVANGAVCCVAAFLCWWTAPVAACRLVLAAAVAAALADTAASEVGKVFGSRAWVLVPLRRAAPGTRGAVSLAGTLAGLAGSAAVAGVAWGTGFVAGPIGAAVVTLAGMAAMLAESLLPRLDQDSKHGNNLANTIVGALLAFAATLLP